MLLNGAAQIEETATPYLLGQQFCDIPYEKRWTKGTNRCSWPFKNNTSPKRESQWRLRIR
jgi:hypothetical protein